MGCLVGLMCYFFDMKIISLLEEKRIHPDFSDPEVNEVDIYEFDPSDLRGLSESDSDEQGWYFFCQPYYKYAKSKRANRRTPGGYWKITGRGCAVKNKSGQVIGSKKNLVFYRLGGSSKEVKTDWVMHEFYVKDEKDPRYQVEPQPLQTANLVRDPGSLFRESTNSLVESRPLLDNNFVPDQMNLFAEITYPMQVDPQLLAELYSTNSSCWLNQSPLPAPQLPTNPDQYQGFNSSTYSTGFWEDCNMQDFQFHADFGDAISLLDLEN